jgi:hypothetical protein
VFQKLVRRRSLTQEYIAACLDVVLGSLARERQPATT